ncbi:hypothetical protein OIU84_025168 [Salix udensis]|uniref:Prolamin-like domain-containing protein n=1 Tax=Salix udensis TaxID=889485 RepID=A0AAD6KJE8_9ROSI|nr:hypothetical protein OIU84_025168 [Salix udensis]
MLHIHALDGGASSSSLHPHKSCYPSPVRQRRIRLLGLLTPPPICISNVPLFFLNGETYLSPSCCRAIRIIGYHCWPSMLGSLGFTVQEGDILLGYCDATAHSSSPPPDPIFFPDHS